LRDPLLVGASAQHARDDITIGRRVPALRQASAAAPSAPAAKASNRRGRARQPYNRS
jgi:hypothetical protein